MLELSQSEELLINELLEKSVSQKKIAPLKIEKIVKLSGDASTRKYYRIFSAGKNFVACIDSPENLTKENFNFLTTQKILHQSGVNVPEIYDSKTSRGYVLMQDLGDETLLTQNARLSGLAEEETNYKYIVDELFKIHTVKKESNELHSLFSQEFDFEKFSWEINFTSKNLIQGYLKNPNQELVAEINELFRPIIDRILKIKKIPVHRDFHSRNIMLSEQKYYIIDFQDARQGPVQYDLVSLLEDAYFQVQRSCRYRVQEYFYKMLKAEKLINNDFEEFIYEYEQCAIQRIYKAIGTFCYIFIERGDDRYIRYVHNCFERLKSILYRYDEYKDLRKKLSEAYYQY